jgi:hypothetical protein
LLFIEMRQCNFFVRSRNFCNQFVCLFFHVKFLTILASIVGYDLLVYSGIGTEDDLFGGTQLYTFDDFKTIAVATSSKMAKR